jgi:hypothetical protein
MTTLTWDFEDNTLQGWVADDANFQIYSSPTRPARGSYSAGIRDGSVATDVAHVSPSELSGGVKIDYVEFWYQEEGSSHGGGISIVDSSGNEVIGFATSNSDWCIKDGNGWEELSSNDGDTDKWIKVKIILDWDAGTADIEANQDGGTLYSYTDRPLINSTNVESIYFKGFANTGGGWESGTDQYMYLDDIVVEWTVATPEVTTNAADSISETTATLNGTLDDLGGESSVDVYFEWGETTSYGSTTTQEAMSATGAFDAGISGLTSGTTYHFRAAVTDSVDTWYGADAEFTAGAGGLNTFFGFPF